MAGKDYDDLRAWIDCDGGDLEHDYSRLYDMERFKQDNYYMERIGEGKMKEASRSR